MDIERSISREILFAGRVVTLERRQVALPDGRTAEREIIRHNGGAGILPIDAEGNVYMVKQYRCAMDEFLLEIPAGKLEVGEDPELCALRELEEETGYKAASALKLGEFYPTPGYDTEVLHLYLARELTVGVRHLDQDEFVSVVKIPFDELYQMALRAELKDAKTTIAVLLAATLLGVAHE